MVELPHTAKEPSGQNFVQWEPVVEDHLFQLATEYVVELVVWCAFSRGRSLSWYDLRKKNK